MRLSLLDNGHRRTGCRALDVVRRNGRDRSYAVTDADVERLRAAGHSEDEIFEVTVAAAVGAALGSLDAGLRALDGEAVRPELRGDSRGGSAPRE